MPICEEEQVLMCRLVLDRLRPGDLVLDVGTGSGVFGIWAAKKQGCRVVGIDVSVRAIEFARENAQRNGVLVAKAIEGLADGQIHFIHCAYENFVREEGARSRKFDVIFLNPPFNPTCPLIKPALHADAGPDAERPFRSQIKLTPRVQKVGGYCLGYQMSYDMRAGEVRAIAEIRRAFRNRCRIRYAHVLKDTHQFPVEPFLRAQYSGFLGGDSGREGAIMERYIRRVGGRGQLFSLIYYEVRKENSPVLSAPREVDLGRLPHKTWQDRIWLHRRIVESSSRRR